MAAVQAGYQAFRLSLQNPNSVVLTDELSRRQNQYALGWSAYTNDAFSRVAQWAAYAECEGLYARTKGFENPTTRLVDFYVGVVFDGILTNDGNSPPDGSLLAIPLSRDTDEKIRLAVAQSWQWSNWQEEKDTWVLYGSSMGDAPALVVDDPERGIVYSKAIMPGYVKEVDFNPRGDVTYYKIEYSYYDRVDERQKTYRQECDKAEIRTWADTKRDPVIEENPYQFVPMVWARHRKTLNQFGAPAIRSWDKIERLNSLVSRIDANIRIHSQSPGFLFGAGDATALAIDGTKNSDDLKIIQVRGDGELVALPNNLELEQAIAVWERLSNEIEKDHPETTMYEKLADMTQLTGPAAERILGNVRGYVQGARGRYDNQYRKLAQMTLAIGGMRYAQRNRPLISGERNGWADNTEAQQKFAPFNLDSYARGDLDFSIDPRPLVPQTTNEKWLDQQTYFAAKRAGLDAEFSMQYQMSELDNMSQDQINDYERAKQEDDLNAFGDGFNAETTNPFAGRNTGAVAAASANQ